MTILSADRILLGGHAADRSDAIHQAGQLLVQTGCVTPEYIDGMLAREQSMSTYLKRSFDPAMGSSEREHILKLASPSCSDGIR
jgi:PTS system mannitol-specific IIA component